MRRTGAAALAAAALAAAAGCGGADGGGGPLAWVERPYFGNPSKLLPNDYVVLGEVRNGGSERVRVHHEDVRLLDADGREVPASVRFTATWGHGLYPPTREPQSVRPAEDVRIGRALDLAPGGRAPVMVAWRGDRRPVTIDYRDGRLGLPE